MADEIRNLKIQGNTFSYKVAHFHQHANVLMHLQEALDKIIPELKDEKNGTFTRKTVDLGRPLGKREVIELNGDEEIFYAQRKGRRTLTKFVRGVKAQDCSCVTFVVNKLSDNKFKIITAYLGYAAEKEPLDPSIKDEAEFNKCKEYWGKTAMIEGSQQIYKNTITKECPWDKFENRISISMGNKNNVQEKIQEMRTKQQNNETENKPKI